MIYMKHVGLYVDNIEQMTLFYKDVFDMQVIFDRVKDSGELYNQLYECSGCEVIISKLITPYGKETGYGEMVELIKVACEIDGNKEYGLREKPIYGYGTAHISFGVENICDTVSKVLKHGGIKKTNIISIGLRKCCFVLDPEYNWIELIE